MNDVLVGVREGGGGGFFASFLEDEIHPAGNLQKNFAHFIFSSDFWSCKVFYGTDILYKTLGGNSNLNRTFRPRI